MVCRLHTDARRGKKARAYLHTNIGEGSAFGEPDAIIFMSLAALSGGYRKSKTGAEESFDAGSNRSPVSARLRPQADGAIA